MNNKRKPRRRATGGGAFGNGPSGPQKKGTGASVSQAFADNLNPGAICPANREGRN